MGSQTVSNRKMLFDVLTQQRHCRNITLGKSYNRAVVETGSGTYAPFCLKCNPNPAPVHGCQARRVESLGKMKAPVVGRGLAKRPKGVADAALTSA